MILLKGKSLTAKSRFEPESMSLSLEERNSTATMTLGPEAPAVNIGDWLKDDTEPGKGIVWRVKSLDEDENTQTRTVNLEHVVQCLKDMILFGEAKPATITGKKGATSCTARQAAAYAMGKQSDWKLGDVEVNPTRGYCFNGENVFAALEMVTSSLDSVQWEYDLTAYPFTLHIRKQPEDVASEMRMHRNVTNLKRRTDKSRMYTRIYPVGKNNLHLSGSGYLSKNESIWGTVCKPETDSTIETVAELKAWAQDRLNRHCEPLITVTVTGLDLSRSTGEKLDKITLGRRCRLPLPDKGITITARVTKLNWGDKIKKPEEITVTMANNVEDVASIVNRIQEEISGGRGGGGRYGATKNEEDHAWFVDTTTHVGMVAEAIAGEGADKDWSRVASVMVDGNGISQRVTKTENDMVTAQAKIDVTEKSINQVVTAVGKDGKVTAASICTAIENGGSAARISADHIVLNGNTTLSGTMTINNGSLVVQKAAVFNSGLTIGKGTLSVLSSSSIKLNGSTPGSGMTISYNTMKDLIKEVQIYGPSNNQYKLQYKTMTNSVWQDAGTFSRAVASWDESWSGGNFRVKAQPQNQEAWTAIAKGTESWSGRTVTIPIVAYNSNAPGTQVSTGYSVSATYVASKSDISVTRSRKTSEPSTDASLTWISSNGWYQFDVTACGVTKTYKIEVDVS